jgi:adenylate kinase
MLNIVLFGPPGAGKGTQAEKIIEKYGLVHLSTGDILRSELANSTELGLQARKFMDKGELVPDNVVIGMIETNIDRNYDAKGFIFDGFPRTTAQAEALDELMAKKVMQITAMLMLSVDYDELVKRLLNRGKKAGRSDDQDMSIIENRIKVYNTETAPLIDYYNLQNKFHHISGMGTIEEIFERICQTISNLKSIQ